MINLLISVALGVVFALAVRLAHFSLLAGIVPGMIAFAGSYVLLARRVAVKVQALMNLVQNELATLPPNKKREQQARVDKAVKLLESGLVYDRWQFLIGPEIHANIGMIKYMFKDLDGAAIHLNQSSARNYMALAMKGALLFQRKDYPGMKAAFEAAVKPGKKEALVWAVYAWCLLQLKEKDSALEVMARAAQSNPSDEKLKASLSQLQNDKRMKMKPYEPAWWQFGLEAPPMDMSGGRQVRFQRR